MKNIKLLLSIMLITIFMSVSAFAGSGVSVGFDSGVSVGFDSGVSVGLNFIISFFSGVSVG